MPAEIYGDPVFNFTSGHFTPFINTDFVIRQEGRKKSDAIRLLNVKEHEAKKNVEQGVTGDSFSLMFYSPRGTVLAGGQYEFTHPSLGAFNLTLLPVSADRNRFEAIINHLRP